MPLRLAAAPGRRARARLAPGAVVLAVALSGCAGSEDSAGVDAAADPAVSAAHVAAAQSPPPAVAVSPLRPVAGPAEARPSGDAASDDAATPEAHEPAETAAAPEPRQGMAGDHRRGLAAAATEDRDPAAAATVTGDSAVVSAGPDGAAPAAIASLPPAAALPAPRPSGAPPDSTPAARPTAPVSAFAAAAPTAARPAARATSNPSAPAAARATPPTAVEAAAARLAAGDAVGAERAFRRLLVKGGAGLHAMVGLGAALRQQGRAEEAETVLIGAVGRWPRSPVARNNLAAVHLDLGRREAALAELAAARRLAEAEGASALVAGIDRNIALVEAAGVPQGAGAAPPGAPDRPTHRLIPKGAGRWRLEPAPAEARPTTPDAPEDSA